MSGNDEIGWRNKQKNIYKMVEERMEEAKIVMNKINELAKLYMQVNEINGFSNLNRTFVIDMFKIKHKWMTDVWTVSYKTGRFSYEKIIECSMTPAGRVERVVLYIPNLEWLSALTLSLNNYRETSVIALEEKACLSAIKEEKDLKKRFGLEAEDLKRRFGL